MTALDGGELDVVWQKLAENLSPPSAILVISAHWTAATPSISSAKMPETIYDFYGFPDALYQMRYPAQGAPLLAERIKEALCSSGFSCKTEVRGLDHGVWIPLKMIFPKADIPVVSFSVEPRQDAHYHDALGKALAFLRSENVLIIASGHMTHNLRDYMQTRRGKDKDKPAPESIAFRDFVHEALLKGEDECLKDWLNTAPNPYFAHPTPEHFLPLFVALGASSLDARTVEHLGGGWVDNALAADNYCFL